MHIGAASPGIQDTRLAVQHSPPSLRRERSPWQPTKRRSVLIHLVTARFQVPSIAARFARTPVPGKKRSPANADIPPAKSSRSRFCGAPPAAGRSSTLSHAASLALTPSHPPPKLYSRRPLTGCKKVEAIIKNLEALPCLQGRN
jgi:hypothetical protein